MKRRNFLSGLALTALSSGLSMTLTGCNVFDDIYNWAGIAIASLNSIVAILKANGVFPAVVLVNAILGALNALRGAITEYKSTTPPPVGSLARIETFLKDATDQFTTFLQSLGIGGGLFTMIASLVGIIVSTIAGFLNKLPKMNPPLVATAQHRAALATMAQSMGVAVIPKHRTVRVFKKDWNAALDASPSLDVIVPQSAYHKISLLENL